VGWWLFLNWAEVQAKPCNTADGTIGLHSCDPTPTPPTPTPTPPAEDPSIDHSSPNYALGGQLLIDGDNYPPETHLKITLDGIAIGQVFTDTDGQFRTQTHLPAPGFGFEPGVYPLRVGEIGAREWDIQVFAPFYTITSGIKTLFSGNLLTLTENCNPGDEIVSGGYSLLDASVDNELEILANIPQGDTGWTIKVHNPSNRQFDFVLSARCAR